MRSFPSCAIRRFLRRHRPNHSPRPSHSSAAGFSLVEALISMLILLLVSIAALPLFVQAGANNMSGRDSTSMTGYARTSLETVHALPFSNAAITIPPGTDRSSRQEWWLPTHQINAIHGTGSGYVYGPRAGMAEGAWTDDGTNSVVTNNASWARNITVRQYNISDMRDNKMFDNPLPGQTPPAHVQLKEVVVEVRGARGVSPDAQDAFGEGRNITLRYLKTF